MLGRMTGRLKRLGRRVLASSARMMSPAQRERRKRIAWQMREFSNATGERRASVIEGRTGIPDLLKRIVACGIPLRSERISIPDFKKWRESYRALEDQYLHAGDAQVEKLLEHYLTMTFLPYTPGEVLIDMAAAGSRLADILTERSGQACYRLDAGYPAGRNENRIGADVGRSGLPDAFADALTFHCAFECLQGDADIRFVGEARRILRSGGRWGIVPLYLDGSHFVKLGPRHDRRAVTLAAGETWVWRDDAYLDSPFSRHYSPESFSARIFSACGAFACEIIHFNNLEELRRAYPGQRLYCHFLFRARKK